MTASMRRRLEPIDDSLTTLISPMSPAARTWVPPHSSIELPTSSTLHDVAVLVAEEGDGTEGAGFVLRRLEHSRRRVGQRLGVGDALDLGDLLVGDGVVVAEVEPQPVGRDERARPA